SIPLPGVDNLDPGLAVKVCKIANDGLAEVCGRSGSRFVGLAILPIQAGEEAGDELRRSVKDLGLKGGYLHSNSLGHYLDSAEYLSSMNIANNLGVPMFVHPTTPNLQAGMDEYRLATTFGLQVDLSLSILRLVFSSALESMPGLRLIVSHLGSTLPFISNRIDDEFQFAKSPETMIPRKPSEYMRRLYVDTVTMDPRPLEFAKNYFGADHIVFGSDYPFWETGLHVQAVENSSLATEEKEMVFSRTARQLLKL
ncbi:MAG: amidohydrolase family protein, partial [Nitrososphaerales archaeon]